MAPILVTGAHRSGTTWVGKVLAASPDHAYVSEPLHVQHSRGMMAAPVDHWYTYICEENQRPFLTAYRDTLQFRYRPLLALKHARSVRDALKILRDLPRFFWLRSAGSQPVLKDPFAVFSAPWFQRRLGCRVVITVRHPLGFISSLKRLGWTFDFQHLLAQPLLIRDHLGDFQQDMLQVQQAEGDIIQEGILLWKMIYSVVAQYRERGDDFVILRHEDLSMDPMGNFSDVCSKLEMRFSDPVQDKIRQTTQQENPRELPEHDEHAVTLDSRANLTNWQHRLTSTEVERIVNATADSLFGFYEPEEWKLW